MRKVEFIITIFLLLQLAYSEEIYNPSADGLSYLNNPECFGFPVFGIIDGDGNVLHTQDSALLRVGAEKYLTPKRDRI
jgi:hypothetical protein